MNAIAFENDIPLAIATAAHSGTSMTPDVRGHQERASYATQLQQDYEYFREQAEKGGTLALLESEFARYRQGLAQRTRSYLHSRSRCMSTLVTGPSNFPTARNQRRNRSADNKAQVSTSVQFSPGVGFENSPPRELIPTALGSSSVWALKIPHPSRGLN